MKILLATILVLPLLGSCTKPDSALLCSPANHWHTPGATCIVGKRRVELEEGRIRLLEKIQFEQNEATLKMGSRTLLDEVTDILRTNEDVEFLRIEGHTSSEGERDFNMQLSNDRAMAVRDYLIQQGIGSDRLIARGYGPDSPVASNDTEEGRELNRRVQLTILKRGGEVLLEDEDPYAEPDVPEPATDGEAKTEVELQVGGSAGVE